MSHYENGGLLLLVPQTWGRVHLLEAYVLYKEEIKCVNPDLLFTGRKRGQVVTTLDSQSGGLRFEFYFGHLLDLFLVILGSNPYKLCL